MVFRNILILSSIFCAVSSVCMNDWTRFDDSCYYFAHRPNQRIAWHEAVQACSWNESHLVIVETKSEHEFIKSHLAELNPASGEQFWTYGNDIHDENIWTWGETPGNTIMNTFWHPGQPDNNANGEDCLAYKTGWHFDWNDALCGRNEFYICEITDSVDGGIIG